MPGPYEFVGYYDATTIGHQILDAQNTLSVTSSSLLPYMKPPQEGDVIGSCDHCYQAIAYAVVVKGANGKFKVGETCAKKICDAEPKIASEAKQAANQRRAKARKTKLAAAYQECIDRLERDRSILADRPHPKGWEGKTLADYLDWYRYNAGRAKFVEIFNQAVK